MIALRVEAGLIIESLPLMTHRLPRFVSLQCVIVTVDMRRRRCSELPKARVGLTGMRLPLGGDWYCREQADMSVLNNSQTILNNSTNSNSAVFIDDIFFLVLF